MNTLLQLRISSADPTQVAGLSRFFKTGPGQYGEGDKFLGIKVPVTRGVVKECWRSVGLRELDECIGSEYHEVRLGRETAQKQDARTCWQERLEGVGLEFHCSKIAKSACFRADVQPLALRVAMQQRKGGSIYRRLEGG